MPLVGGYAGAALLQAFSAYAETMEGAFQEAYYEAIVNLTGQGDLPLLMEQLQRGVIIPEDLPVRVTDLFLDSEQMRKLIKKIVQESAVLTAKTMKFEMRFDVTQPAVLEQAHTMAGYRIKGINDATMRTINDTIRTAIETQMPRHELVRTIRRNVGLLPNHALAVNNYEQTLTNAGTAPARVAKLANDYAGRLRQYRAKMIARTEVAAARSHGQQLFWLQGQQRGFIPPGTQRIWMTAEDERVCPICGPMNDVVTGLNATWQTDNGPVMVPTDAHPQCRCAMALVFPKSVNLDLLRGLGTPAKKKELALAKAADPTTGEPNPVTGEVMTPDEFTDTLKALFHARAGRLSGFKRAFGKGVKPQGEVFKTAKALLEVQSCSLQAENSICTINRQDVISKNRLAKAASLKSGAIVQVVDFDRGAVSIWAHRNGLINYSTRHHPSFGLAKSTSGTPLELIGEYKFTRKQWYAAQKSSGWGEYDYPMVKNELEWRTELSKSRTEPTGRATPQDGASVIQVIGGQPAIWVSDVTLAKFNPNHDELGRFSSADSNLTGSGSGLAHQLMVVKVLERAGKSPDPETLSRIMAASPGELEFVVGHEDPLGLPALFERDPDLPPRFGFTQKERADIKQAGAAAVAQELTPDERQVVYETYRDVTSYSRFEDDASRERWPASTDPIKASEGVISKLQTHWAASAGDHNKWALAIQLAAAQNAGWSKEEIRKRVFYDFTDEDYNSAERTFPAVVARMEDTGGSASDLYFDIANNGKGGLVSRSQLTQTLVINALVGESQRAILSARERITQRDLAGIGETVTLFRGVAYEKGTAPFAEGESFRSASSPMTSWSLDYVTAEGFANRNSGYGNDDDSYILQADVPVTSIVGYAGLGGGCIVEAEVIVGAAKFSVSTVPTSREATPPPWSPGNAPVPVSPNPGTTAAIGEPVPLGKAQALVNLDALLHNQDWVKQTDDTDEALGLTNVSKFNPNHDELGRFSSADNNTTGGVGGHEGKLKITNFTAPDPLREVNWTFKELPPIARAIFEVQIESEDGTIIVAKVPLDEDNFRQHDNIGRRVTLEGLLFTKDKDSDEQNPAGRFKATVPTHADTYRPASQEGAISRDPYSASIDMVLLNQEHTGKGIGTALFSHWESQLAQAGVEELTVHASSFGELNGAYTWAKYGITPNASQVNRLLYDFVLAKMTEEKLYERDQRAYGKEDYPDSQNPRLPTSAKNKVAALLGMPDLGSSVWQKIADSEDHYMGELGSDEGTPTLYDKIQHFTEEGTYFKEANTYEDIHGQDLFPLIEIPSFKDWLINGEDPNWFGTKEIGVLAKAGSQRQAIIAVCNRWMRENPAGLENDDPQFFKDIKAARATAISKYNPNHDELGRFSSADNASNPPALNRKLASKAMGSIPKSYKEAAVWEARKAGVLERSEGWEELIPKLTTMVQEELAKRSLFMRASPETLKVVAEGDGSFRPAENDLSRDQAQFFMFGYRYDGDADLVADLESRVKPELLEGVVDPTTRPVYGYLGSDKFEKTGGLSEEASQRNARNMQTFDGRYGAATIKFKDTVKERTTVTFIDSLYNSMLGHHILKKWAEKGGAIAGVKKEVFTEVGVDVGSRKNRRERVFQPTPLVDISNIEASFISDETPAKWASLLGNTDPYSRDREFSANPYDGGYFETQIHNTTTLDDVSEVIVEKSQVAGIREMLDANGYSSIDVVSRTDSVSKYNPNHDELGRFTSADGATAGGAGLEAHKAAFKNKYGYEPQDGDGDCYPTALKEATEMLNEPDKKDVEVVHGTPRGQGEIEGVRFGHAWVEYTPVVPDEVLNNIPEEYRHLATQEMPRMAVDRSNGNKVEVVAALYYSIGQMTDDDVVRYSVEAASELANDSMHYGPWQ